MSASPLMRRWMSLEDDSAAGLELLGAPHNAAALGAALDAVRGVIRRPGTAFLLVQMISTDHAEVEAAVERASASGTEPRVCLAIDRSTLSRVESRRLDTSRVGLLLDDVDADTPPSEIVHDAIEAIRFRFDFVQCAARHIRLGCALEATLHLARNLGLTTLAPSTALGDGMLVPGVGFDWQPSLAGNIAAATLKRKDRTLRDVGPGQGEFQLSR